MTWYQKINDWISKHHFILLILLVCVSVFVVYNALFNNPKTNTELYKKLIEQHEKTISLLTDQNKSLQKSNEDLNKSIERRDSRDSIWQLSIIKNNEAITQLNKKLNEKVSAVDHFSANDIKRFFSDRYSR